MSVLLREIFDKVLNKMISKTVLKVIRANIIIDLLVGSVIAISLWKSIGTEAMAQEFCSLTKVKMCEEIEWSENEPE